MTDGVHLKETQTNINIESRVNWDSNDFPEGKPPGEFVAHLHVTAKVTSQNSGMSIFIDLLLHINLVDNYHYLRNIFLPGNADDLYVV